MDDIAKETFPANLEQEMRQSYLDYAMSVIVVGRCLMYGTGFKPVAPGGSLRYMGTGQRLE